MEFLIDVLMAPPSPGLVTEFMAPMHRSSADMPPPHLTRSRTDKDSRRSVGRSGVLDGCRSMPRSEMGLTSKGTWVFSMAVPQIAFHPPSRFHEANGVGWPDGRCPLR